MQIRRTERNSGSRLPMPIKNICIVNANRICVWLTLACRRRTKAASPLIAAEDQCCNRNLRCSDLAKRSDTSQKRWHWSSGGNQWPMRDLVRRRTSTGVNKRQIRFALHDADVTWAWGMTTGATVGDLPSHDSAVDSTTRNGPFVLLNQWVRRDRMLKRKLMFQTFRGQVSSYLLWICFVRFASAYLGPGLSCTAQIGTSPVVLSTRVCIVDTL